MTPKDTSAVDATNSQIEPDVQYANSGQTHIPRIWALLNDELDLYSPHDGKREGHWGGSAPDGA